MKISKLLEQDRLGQGDKTLAQNFGDGFLYTNNRIYKNVREAVIKNGYSFSSEQNSFYQALPFSQLERILANKVIPLNDNVTVLEQLTARLRDAIEWDDISDGLKKNYVFHESCHGVARAVAKDTLTSLKDMASIESQRLRTLQILMEESFSNTCELLAVSEAQDPIHRIFYEQNSYTFLFEDRTNLKNAMRDIGEKIVFKFMFLSYLHSNFLFQGLEEKQINAILKMIGDGTDLKLDPKHLKTLKALSRIAFTLDVRFRTVTTRFHLRLNGLQLTIEKLLDFNFLESITAHKEYRVFLNSLTDIALKQ
ncbi:MAG: hypothetical protein V4736_01120 [Bdellovibrionota bacterium]